MENRRKNMSYYIVWINKEEEQKIREIFKKKTKTQEELNLLGEIFSKIGLRGDIKLK